MCAGEFETACRAGGTSLFGTGLNPGFVAEKITAAATGICLDIDRIQIAETFDVSGVPVHDYVFNVLGFGSDPACFDFSATGPISELMGGMYTEVIALLVKRLGLVLDRVVADHRVAPAPAPIPARAGIIPAGTVAATHWRWHGIVGGKRFVTLNISWIMGTQMADRESSDHWKIMIRGQPGIDIAINLVEPENTGVKTRSEQYAVAGSVINSIPEVCAAEPGVYESPVFSPFWKHL